MRNLNLHKTLLGLFCLLLGLMIVAPVASADIEDLTLDTGCTRLPSYTGEQKVSKGKYDVYVRLAKRGERAEVASYFKKTNGAYGACQKLHTVRASGDQWTRAGTISVAHNDRFIFQLASESLELLPDANRPSVMVVSHANPLCIPKNECEVTIDGQRGYVRPTSNLLNKDSLHVLQVQDPLKDRITRVRYYIDDKLLYTTPEREEFDQRYISYPGQRLSRVIEYASGQQIVLDSLAPEGVSDSLEKFVFRLSKQNPTLLTLLGIILVVIFIGLILRAFIYKIQQRQAWREHHGFTKHKPNIFDELGYLINRYRVIRWLRVGVVGIIGVILMITLIVTTYTYGFQTATIDGRSMERQYHTGDQVLVSKLQKTIATINGLEYVPKRGDIVVVNAVFGNAKLSSTDNTNLLLIKRVIALPGERVVIKNGILTVYSPAYPDGFQPDKGSSWESTMTPDVKTEHIDITLGKGELFVSGDNRPASIDSRFNGPIDTREVVGQVILKW